MAVVEPYSPCPCGSGQKFKWCCHKVESFVEKAQRLYENGQVEAAIKVLDDGLRKEPGNPWLLTRKAVFQIRQEQVEPAKATLRQVLQKDPKHMGALVLLTRCVLETEGPVNGAGMFQQVLASTEESKLPQLAGLARVVAILLGEAGQIPSSVKHLDLVARLGGPDQAGSALRSIESNAGISPWQKDRLELAPAPSDLDDDARRRFDEALILASKGLWAPAAAAFDRLSQGRPGGEADYNLGLCRLWLGDSAGAVGPIRRRSRQLGPTAEAVDLEILAQQVEPIHPDDRIEQVQLTWPLRNREALLAALRSKPEIFDEGPMAVDPEDPASPQIDTFALLDRPAINEAGTGLTFDRMPVILGRVLVESNSAVLETYDDGRVDSLGDRFTALAGTSIAPAHPRTKVLGIEARSTLALAWEWLYPENLERTAAESIERAKRARVISETWPVTPMPYLGFKTPEQAAKDGHFAIPLRAALCLFEQDRSLGGAVDFPALRSRLKVEPEPIPDPDSADLEHLALARLASVPLDRLSDERLALVHRRARRAMVVAAMDASARSIVARPSMFEKGLVDPVSVHSDLASLAAGQGKLDEAFAWIEKGRQADSPIRRGANAPLWDMVEIRLRARSERPEAWVPELAVVLERYGQEPNANQIILLNLVEMGLVRLTPNPDDPQDVLLDSRPLQAVLGEYGPRVTTASGRLGVSATKPEIWTPGGPSSGSGGALWTPGSGPANASGDKPKQIITGGR